MSIAALTFTATLPTYNKVGANGTTFAKNTLSASGSVLVNTNDSSTGLPSVLNSNLIANGLDYSAESFSLSGDTLTVIYGLPATDTAKQNLQAADQATVLTNGLPGNNVNFTASATDTTGNQDNTSYSVSTAGVVGAVPPRQGSAIASTVSGDGTNVSISSITTGPDNTLEVSYTVAAGSQNTAPVSVPSITVSQNNQNGVTATTNGASSVISIFDGLSASAQSGNLNANGLSAGSLLAQLLSPTQTQSVGVYNLVAGFGASQPSSTLSVFA